MIRRRYQSQIRVYANTYQEAIEKAGAQFDALWGNGNWELMACRAEPHLYDNVGEVMLWQWDIDIDWLGLGKGK